MKGLYGKYKIEKADGSKIDENADYFVLRLDTDTHARAAIQGYINSINKSDPLMVNTELQALKRDLIMRLHHYIYGE